MLNNEFIFLPITERVNLCSIKFDIQTIVPVFKNTIVPTFSLSISLSMYSAILEFVSILFLLNFFIIKANKNVIAINQKT